FKIDDSDLKNKGGKPTVRVSNVGHTLHVWLNGEYHGNGHGSHDEKSPWLEHDCVCGHESRSAFPMGKMGTVSRHPSNWKLWVVVIASGLAMLLEIYDFPPYGGYFDAHSIWHLATVPAAILWWSFIRDDAEFRISSLLKKPNTKAK
uniref:Post-GPI attachment to proteins factor 3 n=1 Tax=Brassica oleracea var. oleracea TaxID=109376 RepID=A0A0D3AII5_BRAOL